MNQGDLKNYDFIVLIDKSGSMSANDCPGGKTRWAYAQEQTENMARKCAEYDSDGIDVVVFAGTPKLYSQTTPDKVHQIFKENSPGGATDTAAAIKLVTEAYFAKKAAGTAKPIIAICITDGEPTDEKALVNVIIDATKRIDSEDEIGITFLQVGKDEAARAFLQRLDDNLVSEGAKFDIVDTKNESEMEALSSDDILLEAVNG